MTATALADYIRRLRHGTSRTLLVAMEGEGGAGKSTLAADFDAVHPSVAGHLASATRPLPLADPDGATVLAGWNPDQTWWLTAILETVPTEPQMWRKPDNRTGPPHFAWHPTG